MRMFVAVELSEEIRDRLSDLQERLSLLGKAVRWTRPEQIHLTVKFLGEVQDERVPEVCAVAEQVAASQQACTLSVRGAGCFPSKGSVRVLWVGMPEVPAPLAETQRLCEERYAQLGFSKENRAFRPHLTIGRTRDHADAASIRSALKELADFDAGTFDADELVVFQSMLKPQGPTYIPMARAKFQG